MTKIINIFAGPGAGKSTTAAKLFSLYKCAGYSAELVTEYAKDMTWEQREPILQDQLYILAKQNRRVSRLIGKVDYVITDSPIIMGLAYVPDNYYKNFAPFVKEVWDSYDNHSFFIGRSDLVEYQEYGRNHNYAQAVEIDGKIKEMLASHNISFEQIPLSETLADTIFERTR